MDILQKTTIIVYFYFINTHYGINGMMKNDLFVYPIETADLKSGAKEKGKKFGNKINKKDKD